MPDEIADLSGHPVFGSKGVQVLALGDQQGCDIPASFRDRHDTIERRGLFCDRALHNDARSAGTV
ncbi:hypothetical protein NJ76_28670 [Rhodococcus sp. IITR03]|nr:hypothetical protein NJ76_28670 [Rhodococcus sp. IITR03]